MPAAARVGDLTGHGAPLSPGPGSTNVLIGGMPAWRAIDVHACPVSTPQPHGGGSLVLGSLTVSINGSPAARMGDQILEAVGGPDPIASGCPTVLIGG